MTPWLLVAGDFTRLGGMDRANHALATHLARRGTPVHLVAHRVADDLAALSAVRVHLVSRPAGVHLAGFPLLSARARRVARALGPSARVLANGGNVSFAAPTWMHYLHAAFRPVAAPSVRWRMSAALSSTYFRFQERRSVPQSPLILCNSRRTAMDVQERYGVPEFRTRVVYYGTGAEFGEVKAEEAAASRRSLGIGERRVALFIGTVADRRKGFDVLFDAWRQLCADPAWDVDLLVAGAGAGREDWPVRVAAAGLHERICFLGFHHDVSSLLAATDLLVHPVRYEAYGLGVHEAICRGVPAIVTDSAGVAERYPAELRGLLVPDPPAVGPVVEALRRWRRDADGWRTRTARLATALRARTWDDMSRDIVALMEEARR